MSDIRQENGEEETRGIKHKREDGENGGAGVGSQVASHYNRLEEKGVEHRKESRIYYMRNLNNWIKSMILQDYSFKLKNSGSATMKVLDIGCGKGGDLLKWQKSQATHLVGVDIAETSIEQCKDRYHRMKGRSPFTSEFYAADCTKVRTRDLYEDPDVKFDIVSCQFAFHYCFESLPQAECMLRNISENLRVGGFFIGTTPCAYEIMSRAQKAESGEFGNSVYKITLDEGVYESPPIFGGKYNFHLEGVVDCPEFLVYFPVMKKLAEKYGLLLIQKERFGRYFHKKKNHGSNEVTLLRRMSALEPYPSNNLFADKDQYTFAESALTDDVKMVGTLSRDEWEALNIYTVFAFKKMNEIGSTPT